jgi:hypothetical protein
VLDFPSSNRRGLLAWPDTLKMVVEPRQPAAKLRMSSRFDRTD